MDQEEEARQLKLEGEIAAAMQKVYDLLLKSDRPRAETQRGFIAEWKEEWEK